MAPDGIQLAEVTVVGPKGDVPLNVYSEVQRELGDLVGSDHAITERTARMVVHVEILAVDDFISDAGYHDGCGAIPLLVAAPTGANIESEKLRVDVTIQAGGRTLRGSGFGEKGGSLYARSLRRSLASALDRAMKEAAWSAS